MANLIDQMNILKGLDDQSLGAELNAPSGAVPPYLVMSEISRRKDMRQRYEGQLARQQPATTVLQDQLSGLAPPSGVAAGQGAPQAMPGGFGSSPAGQGAPMPAPMGISAAPSAGPPTGYRHGGIVHYAGGGMVGDPSSPYWLDPDQSVDDTVNLPVDVGVPLLTNADTVDQPSGYMQGINASGINVPSQSNVSAQYEGYLNQQPDPAATFASDAALAASAHGQPGGSPGSGAPVPGGSPYDAIAAQYQKIIDSGDSDKKQAQALALIQAGAAIAAGTSPYALSNIGAGAEAGVKDYASSLGDMRTRQAQALAGLSSVQQAKLAQQNEQFNQGMSTSDLAIKQQQLKDSEDPNSPQNLPQAIREANYVNNMPEDTQAQRDAKAAMKITTSFAAQAAATKASAAETIADGVHNGTIDPNMPGMYGTKPQVIAAMATKYPNDNLVQMQQQASAASRNIQSMNSTQQLRLRQQIGELSGANGQPGMLDKLQQTADDWNGSGLPPLNGVNLMAAKNGAYGEAGIEKATQFQAELADVTPALAGVFSSGNSPTDKALSNAQNIFQADTSKDAFDKLITLARQNLAYRQNALGQGPAGSADNRYNFSGNSGAPAAATATPPVAVTNVPWKVVSQ